MKAAVYRRYGPPDVVQIEDVDAPVAGPDQVLVRVVAAAVTSADARIRAARFPPGFAPLARLAFGVIRPRRHVLGSAFSGVVEAVGRDVTNFAPGERVCGMAGLGFGAHAEYVAVKAGRLVPVPQTVEHTDAAGILFGGTTAMHFLRRVATVRPGRSVLVNGASGAIGTVAVQLAARAGAVVTGVTSAANADRVTELGAAGILDYARSPLSDVSDRFDVVLDTVGNITPSLGRKLITESGIVLLVVATLPQLITARGNVKAGTASEKPEDMIELLASVGDGSLTVVLDRVLPLSDIAAAHARVDSGRKVGCIVVTP